MRRASVWVALLGVAAAGCGDRPTAATSAPPPATTDRPDATADAAPVRKAEPTPVDVKPPAGTGAVVGKVLYGGDPPPRKPIDFGPEKRCHEHHASPPADETLVVSPDRRVRWVLVRIASKVAGTYPPPDRPAVLDQKGCLFTPHVLPVMAGQEVEFRNSDPVLHNVRLEATLNAPFNRNLPRPGDAMKVKFDAAEVGLKVRCDLHPWMGGYVHVMPHPFFAVSGEDGGFAINKVPPGTHKLEAWHETLGRQTREVTVRDGEVKTVEFVFQPK